MLYIWLQWRQTQHLLHWVIVPCTYLVVESESASSTLSPWCCVHSRCGVRLSKSLLSLWSKRLSKSLLSLWSKGSANPCWVCGVKVQQILAEFVKQRLGKSLLSWWDQGSANPCWVCGVRLGPLPVPSQLAVGSLTQYIRAESSVRGVFRLNKPLLSQRLQRLVENLLAHQESHSPLAPQESWESIKRAKLCQASYGVIVICT